MLELTGLIGLIILIVDIWAILKVVQSGATTLAKAIWIAVIFFLPLVGLIVWFLFGPKA
jgi:hypothetical protein